MKEQSTTSHTLSISISIVCFNSPEEELKTLLQSILNSLGRLKASANVLEVPIFLIDNAEDNSLTVQLFEDMQAQMQDLNVQLKLIHGQGNVGYGSAHNLAIRKVESDYHLVLNPDLELEQNCLVAGTTYLSENNDVVMASPYAEFSSGEKQYLCKRYPSVFTFLVRGFFPGLLKQFFTERLANFEMRELSEDRPTSGIPIVSGCYMLCRTKVLQQLDGFDEEFFLYFEDFDLSLRLGKLGKASYVPAMRITHAGGNAAGKGWSHIRMFVNSGLRFFNKHGWRFFRQAS